MSSGLFTIAIIGRPNVGKSTLFNRLIGRRRALVHDIPGVTRDRIEENGEWILGGRRLRFRLIDTGGLGGEHFSKEIKAQVDVAIKEAQAVLLILDGQSGLLPADRELLQELNISGALKNLPVFAVVNKVDAESHEERGAEFYALGLEQLFTISAEHNRGTDDLKLSLMEVAKDRLETWTGIPEEPSDEDETEDEAEDEDHGSDGEADESKDGTPDEFEPRIPKIAIVGKPNVGKSTLLNALLGQQRMITSPIAGTTTDSVDSLVDLEGRKFLFVDTAGVRRKNKTEQGVEVLSVVQTKKAIERAEIVILLIDGDEGMTEQDEKIGGMIEELGRSLVIAVNKWDMQRKNREFTPEVAADVIRKRAAFMRYAPIIFISAKYRQGFDNLGDLLLEILHQRRLKIPTKEFSEWVRAESTVHNPANVKFYLCHQSGRNPPTFVCHVNDPENVHYSLKGYLLNSLRKRWGYMGTPVRLLFVEGKNRRSLPKKMSAIKKTARKLAKKAKK
ncbi:MAG: ribosome biogenesis GTPase Der [Bdellovibrionales bacterium GWC1_52_8]|nr:MAG: ribosome biogenesis GTPase Der [Bdellovibrionales bacterium GWB1_52_6]OFZ05982.1 MAG: ribosome biogenesis GTPase Der [Bdellovibrionales bacterium GWA1_52_35]OFZ40257.1 MAG: ribosome biogenesis GTPase Der [Bdellovibrionales bacterium GWC1_52_8]HCM39399.1 ribosome biogenesis GTPase Der [Bdellovibrionales bacterium]